MVKDPEVPGSSPGKPIRPASSSMAERSKRFTNSCRQLHSAVNAQGTTW